jgi:zinc D-Ala-D-Ala carboxypeptidase
MEEYKMTIFHTIFSLFRRVRPAEAAILEPVITNNPSTLPSTQTNHTETSNMLSTSFNHKTHLSANFTIAEFERSQTAIRNGISNRMTATETKNARRLAQQVLQPIRDQFGITVITSGYRSPEVNRRVGGSRNSQHIAGQAADIRVPGMSNYDLAVWIRANLDYDQLILEAYNPGEVNSGWVHVSYVSPEANRKENLTATFHSGHATYHIGLVK